MTRIYFSSWNGTLVDDRSGNAETPADLEHLMIPEEVEKQRLQAFIGWDGIVVVDPDLDIVAALREYYLSVQRESCGRCIPCRAGSRMIAEILGRIATGGGEEKELALLGEIALLVRECSLCELGISSPVPLLQALEHFRDRFLNRPGTAGEAAETGPEYRSILSAPCRNGCPSHIDIPRYIEAIKDGDFEQALAVNREKTPFVGTLGRVCVHPCESNCNRIPCDQALSIRLLKRFAADFGRKNGDRTVTRSSTAPSSLERVAVIGAGPAGLNAAYQLARLGYRVTVFEALPVAGGMLAVGIPAYRLPRDILDAEVELVKSLGVDINCNVRLGKDITLEQLKAEGFSAVFIATGLHESSELGCEGEDSCYFGYLPGVDFLRNVNLGRPVELGDRVIVIGGGNVAMDCARSAVRLGIREVFLIYRRGRNEMPANVAEIDAAEEEGVKFYLLANPTCILEKDGTVSGMECVRMELGEPDASGRRRPVPLVGSEFILETDTVIPAIGQVADFSFLGSESGLKTTGRGTLAVDADTMATGVPGVFAGGDVVLGARTVIEAVASANRAAVAIDSYLRRGRVAVGNRFYMERHLEKMGVFNVNAVPSMIGGRKRLEEEILPAAERRAGFAEAELGFRRPSEVAGEARRCVKCLRLGLAVLEGEGSSDEENSNPAD